LLEWSVASHAMLVAGKPRDRPSPSWTVERPAGGTSSARGAAWWRLLAIVAVVLGFTSAHACERYVAEFQTFPAVDWLEAQPPLDEAAGIPPAATVIQTAAYVVPQLPIREGPLPFLPTFVPPSIVVRSVSGVRDAAQVVKGIPSAEAFPGRDLQDGASLRLAVVVFHRTVRAAAWADLRSIQLDLRRGNEGRREFRTSGPESRDMVWVRKPGLEPGEQWPYGTATVVGYRGPIGFEMQATSVRQGSTDLRDMVDLSARAEALARRFAVEWTAWLAAEPYAHGW
jgi:hypothetical protein